MKAVKPKAQASVFVPGKGPANDDGAPRTGVRKAVIVVAAQPLRWPTTMLERRRVVKLWRRIAMEILSCESASFRLVAVVPDCLVWTSGEIWSTNDRLAFEGGRCSEKTIQREVQKLRSLGLFLVSYGWKRNDKGEFSKTRSIRLAIPVNYTGQVPADDIDHLDHRCPDGDCHHLDHGCPLGVDHRCPITVEHSDIAGGDRAA